MNPSVPNSLRKNMTPEEWHLWYDFLKNLPVTVRRQKPLGRYIVDFYVASANLVIEIDGGQHYHGEGKSLDLIRDTYLQKRGLQILRYSNLEINRNFSAVCRDIANHLGLFPDATGEKSK